MAPLAPMVGRPTGGIDQHLADGGEDAAHQIKDDEAAVADAVLDVVAEDPQVPHVADHVRPAPVQEHRGDERRRAKMRRDDAVHLQEGRQDVGRQRHLVEPRGRVEGDDRDGDVGRGPGRDDVRPMEDILWDEIVLTRRVRSRRLRRAGAAPRWWRSRACARARRCGAGRRRRWPCGARRAR